MAPYVDNLCLVNTMFHEHNVSLVQFWPKGGFFYCVDETSVDKMVFDQKSRNLN